MAGSIQTRPGVLWSTNSTLFYWLMDRMAEQVSDQRLRQYLIEISEENLGYLDLHDEGLRPAQRQELRGVLARIPEIAQADYPDSEFKADVLTRMHELAAELTS